MKKLVVAVILAIIVLFISIAFDWGPELFYTSFAELPKSIHTLLKEQGYNNNWKLIQAYAYNQQSLYDDG